MDPIEKQVQHLYHDILCYEQGYPMFFECMNCDEEFPTSRLGIKRFENHTCISERR